MTDEPLLLPAARAWRAWGVPRGVLYRAIATGELSVIRSGRVALVPRAEVEAWIARSARPIHHPENKEAQ